MFRKPSQQQLAIHQLQQYYQNQDQHINKQNQEQAIQYQKTRNQMNNKNNQDECLPQFVMNKWHRLTNYNIENRVYRLIDDNDQNQTSQSMQSNIHNWDSEIDEDNDLDREFRQPRTRKSTNRTLTSFNNSRLRNSTNSSLTSSLFKRRSRQLQHSTNNKSYASNIFGSISTLLHHIHSIQLPTLLSYLPFLHPKPTLYSQYKYKSLAILNNSIDLQQAIIKALEYNIPLMQILMKNNDPKNSTDKTSKQSSIIWQRILNNFTIAHFINQNFVLYGDWSYQKYNEIFSSNKINKDMYVDQKSISEGDTNKCKKEIQSGKILFRRGSLVFGEIDIVGLNNVSQQDLLQVLQGMRNRYYQLLRINQQKKTLKQNQKQDEKYRLNDQFFSDNIQQLQHQNQQQHMSPDRLKSIEEQILNDYLQQKKLQQQLLQMQNNQPHQNDPKDNPNYYDNYEEQQYNNTQIRNQYLYQQGNPNYTINQNKRITFNSPNLLIHSRKNTLQPQNQHYQQHRKQENNKKNQLQEKQQKLNNQNNIPNLQDLE